MVESEARNLIRSEGHNKKICPLLYRVFEGSAPGWDKLLAYNIMPFNITNLTSNYH